jgi:hypothetical protein
MLGANLYSVHLELSLCSGKAQRGRKRRAMFDGGAVWNGCGDCGGL